MVRRMACSKKLVVTFYAHQGFHDLVNPCYPPFLIRTEK